VLPEAVPGLVKPASGPLIDRYGRVHDYLRVSVTDRCNYRCTYCMPAAGLDWMPRHSLLTFEEITRIVRVAARCGVERVRLTGGEPTVRKGISELIAMIAAIPGIRDISMTTNGHLFADKAEEFARAGLKRVNISIDSINPLQFTKLTRGGDVRRVLAAIDAAEAAGIGPIKLNAVIIGGDNDDQVEALVEWFADRQVIVRFIEYMPFDQNEPAWRHVPARVLRERLDAAYGLDPLDAKLGGGPATYAKVRGSGLIVGFISPITEHFCQACNRLRLQADGHLRTCLSREAEPSLRDLLRDGITDEGLEQALRDRLWSKVAGHEAHLLDGRAFEGAMTAIGG
jgi:cyclic pyranopterin phosphate synthase